MPNALVGRLPPIFIIVFPSTQPKLCTTISFPQPTSHRISCLGLEYFFPSSQIFYYIITYPSPVLSLRLPKILIPPTIHSLPKLPRVLPHPPNASSYQYTETILLIKLLQYRSRVSHYRHNLLCLLSHPDHLFLLSLRPNIKIHIPPS